jgi:hypothetical protein
MMGDFGQRTLEWRNILWFDGKRDQRLYIGAKEQKKQKTTHRTLKHGQATSGRTMPILKGTYHKQTTSLIMKGYIHSWLFW